MFLFIQQNNPGAMAFIKCLAKDCGFYHPHPPHRWIRVEGLPLLLTFTQGRDSPPSPALTKLLSSNFTIFTLGKEDPTHLSNIFRRHVSELTKGTRGTLVDKLADVTVETLGHVYLQVPAVRYMPHVPHTLTAAFYKTLSEVEVIHGLAIEGRQANISEPYKLLIVSKMLSVLGSPLRYIYTEYNLIFSLSIIIVSIATINRKYLSSRNSGILFMQI